MSKARLAPVALVALFAFGAGVAVDRAARVADAASAPLEPMIVNLPALAAADLPPAAPGATIQAKTLVNTDSATVAVQNGTVRKHYHADANEIQYIIEGSGKFWLGDSYRDVRAGDLIIIPKGTAHAGTTTTFKAIAIKTPPQDPTDVHPVP